MVGPRSRAFTCDQSLRCWGFGAGYIIVGDTHQQNFSHKAGQHPVVARMG
jgi:hypothetical protein